ncbi:hypothetical protein [Ahrensia marina]|uniref:hypothetical protein n=1 Tax=Ahrensia marina TaxID=1514904 RepID=UPI0006B46728|nr:hypothetical protein [Ahrensia marina]
MFELSNFTKRSLGLICGTFMATALISSPVNAGSLLGGGDGKGVSIGGSNGISVGTNNNGGGGLGVGVSVGGSSGVNAGASVGGSSGVNAGASVGGSSGVNASASVGGSSGGINAGANVGGGSGLNANVGIGGNKGIDVDVSLGHPTTKTPTTKNPTDPSGKIPGNWSKKTRDMFANMSSRDMNQLLKDCRTILNSPRNHPAKAVRLCRLAIQL